MKISAVIRYVIFGCALAFVGGCGSGGDTGGGAAKTTPVVSKSALAGTISSTVKGIEITLKLPAGVTVKSDASGQVTAGVIVPLAPNDFSSSNGLLVGYYTPASGGNPGKVKVVATRGTVPFAPGDFFAITCDVAAGVTVTAADFSADPPIVYDANGVSLSGATATLSTI